MSFLDFLLAANTTGELHAAVAAHTAADDYGWSVYSPSGVHLGTYPSRDVAEYARHDEADATNRPVSDFTIRPATHAPEQVAA